MSLTDERMVRLETHRKELSVSDDKLQPLDEAALIEERRKRREAIKARHRGQATPLLAQALVCDTALSTPNAESTSAVDQVEAASRKPRRARARPHTNRIAGASPRLSPPHTPKEISGRDSPTAFVVTDDADLANANVTADDATRQDASAADYDPTMDMEEDKLRQTRHNHKDGVPVVAYDKIVAVDQDIQIPHASVAQPEPVQKPARKLRDEFDMFADEDETDMFAGEPSAHNADNTSRDSAKAVPISSVNALDVAMLDDWDDPDGYYKVILGELLGSRYHVQSNLGKGMFSGVVRATDQENQKLVAIKIIRNNETM